MGTWRSTCYALFVYLLGLLTLPANSDLLADRDALLEFLHGLAAAPRVTDWINGTNPCAWKGVRCNAPLNDRVQSLQLPGIGLYGNIQPGTLGLLTNLQILSLRSNYLKGSLPADLTNCTQLRRLFLQNNLFSGSIPPFGLPNNPALVTIDISFNALTGAIPSSLASLRLRILRLQNNSLSGGIPENFRSNFVDLNLANNSLTGSIPPQLSHLPSSSFTGNPGLCGLPLAACGSPATSPPIPESKSSAKKLNTFSIVLLIILGTVILLLLVACCLVCYFRHRMKQLARSTSSLSAMSIGAGEAKKTQSKKEKRSDDTKEEYSSAQEPAHNKLVFFQGGQSGFDLEDLLRASAEVLGKGSFGTSYKAVLEDGTTVVVKRLKEVVVGRKEFEQTMESVGRLRHRNLVPLRAYYFSKEEKLLVHNYFPLSSLSALLHGSNKTVLDWETRLKIARGAASGIAHIHSISSKMVHGDIKSSNVILKGDHEACVSDYGLIGLFGPNVVFARAGPAVAGYRAPELDAKKPTQLSDVYSFGVVLLELLTGKAPWQVSVDEGMELVRWVQSVVREEWTSEVFDKELMKYEHIEEEMVEMLQLGLACVAPLREERPSMMHVVSTIHNVRPAPAVPDDMSSPDPNNEASQIRSPLTSSDHSSPESAKESSPSPPPLNQSASAQKSS